jgi:hypothetical protein
VIADRGGSGALNKFGPLLALVVLLLAGCGENGTVRSPELPSNPAREVGDSIGLDIPAIAVHVDKLQTFKLSSEGKYNCPRDLQIAAWNREGAVPGEPGLALIIASGQGLFQRLDALQPVDPIYINRPDGTRIIFKRIGQAGTTADARRAHLQLTACGGVAVTVYAELVT